uniref:C2H2-type domain-containing protein n=2 Tax=Phlebotomus papatasi TaxID=29031 RepID=A0A1B0DNG5_PHLPP
MNINTESVNSVLDLDYSIVKEEFVIQDKEVECYQKNCEENKNSQDIQESEEIVQFVITEIKDKKYICEFCNKAFTRLSNLSEHMVTHSSEKNSKCNICPGAFKSQRRLKRHILETHTNETHPCTLCNKTFTVGIKLRRHLRRHSKERRYPCDLCDKRFKDATTRYIHKQVVHLGKKRNITNQE